MYHLLNRDTVKEVAVLSAVALGVTAFRGLRKPPSYECLAQYPRLNVSPFAGILNKLDKLGRPSSFESILRKCDQFMEYVQTANSGSRGFLANRLAREIPSDVQALCRSAQRSASMDVASLAMDLERDELEVVRALCDDMIRNMLLETPPYA